MAKEKLKYYNMPPRQLAQIKQKNEFLLPYISNRLTHSTVM